MSRRIAVWAPNAQRVELVHAGRREPMPLEESGWHAAEAGLSAGDDYEFSLDGGELRPDPRSRCQPQGSGGPSRCADIAGFAWQDKGWRGFPLAGAVIYELHVGTFSAEGTFDGVIGHLQHLVDLGVNAVELMPLATFAGDRGWGYDGVNLYAPHPAYGGPEGLCRLIDACHARGLAVVVDVVYNHLGPEGNHLPDFGPYFTDRYATPWGDAFNYDGPDSDEVRAFVVHNAAMWLEDYHCDGLRLDAVHAIVDTSATHIVEEIAGVAVVLSERLQREIWIIAESDANDPRLVRDVAAGGYGVGAQWNDNFHHALHAVLTGERQGYYVDFGSLDALSTALHQAYVFTGQYSRFRRRRFGRATTGLPLTRFVGYAQNHDQVGNRARGDRLCHLVSPGRARIAAALVLLSPFVPMLFQGEEWAASTPF
ncbi:MAG: malto-oligosyltrehalose trehalohydrolase, partial [Candidatus Dormibacteraeota bacterium]|nr:malto-oligosyltrehalose trehalohydrolase [Candidatus Dormibacteraeota bacterium]